MRDYRIMPWFVFGGAVLALAACSKADSRIGFEKLDDCRDRLPTVPGNISPQSPAWQARLAPVFTFDITGMDRAALSELARDTGARVFDMSRPVPSPEDMQEDALIYWQGGTAYLRLRDRPVSILNATAAGCTLQRPGMRLVGWVMNPSPNASDMQNIDRIPEQAVGVLGDGS